MIRRLTSIILCLALSMTAYAQQHGTFSGVAITGPTFQTSGTLVRVGPGGELKGGGTISGAPTGTAGGSLTGTYPNPGILDSSIYDMLAADYPVAFNASTGHFSLAQSFVPTTRTLTLIGTHGATVTPTGVQDLSANRTWTIDVVTTTGATGATGATGPQGPTGNGLNYVTQQTTTSLGVGFPVVISSTPHRFDVRTSATVATELGVPIAANPTATLTASIQNGIATTFMRSDAAPALPQGLATGSSPTFANITDSAMTAGSVLFAGTGGIVAQDNSGLFYDATNHRLGVGIPTPANLLTVNQGGSATTGFQFISNSSGSSASDGFTIIADTGNNDIYLNQRENAAMRFYDNGVERMTILGNGNVGIAGAAPGEKLDVVTGNARVKAGKLTVNSSTTDAHTFAVGNGSASRFWVDGASGDVHTSGTVVSTGGVVVGSIVGTTTNDNAAAGRVGEFVSATLASGSAITLSDTTPANVTSISLTAGDWDVTGIVNYSLASTIGSHLKSGFGSTSATFEGQADTLDTPLSGSPTTDTFSQPLIPDRASLAGTTTIYLIAQADFFSGTTKAYGYIRARRVR